MKLSFATPFCIILLITLSTLQNISSEPSLGRARALLKVSGSAPERHFNNGTDMIKSACGLTRARDLCISVLKPDPRSASGDIRTFGVIILEKTLSKAKSFPIKEKCPESYRRFVPNILEGIKKLKSDVQTVAFAVDKMSDAIDDVLSCSYYAKGDDLLVRLLRVAMDILLVLP